ncbi:DDE superfamily endonuclease [Popillia japonica]|uniref:DDE superfamily endonuclease n=1 Tax=Popillia japonica TaxID=7064 RepID=A0AAW1K1L2_POPJA
MPTSRSQKRKLLLLTAILAHKRGLLIPRVRMKRRWPIRPINQYRKQFGRFHNTLKVMLKQDPEEFYKYTRLYVAQGSAMCEIARSYLRGRSTVSNIIRETCNAIWEALLPRYMSPPTAEEWVRIKQQFNEKFLFVDIGAQGICGDSGVFRNSDFGSAILNETINIPQNDVLLGTDKQFPCFFVADEAFPLTRNLMRPYPHKGATEKQAIFNYRLSRGRRTIENAFGILASRWRILRKPIIGHPKTVDSIVKAVTILHNFLRITRQIDVFINQVVDMENEVGEVSVSYTTKFQLNANFAVGNL